MQYTTIQYSDLGQGFDIIGITTECGEPGCGHLPQEDQLGFAQDRERAKLWALSTAAAHGMTYAEGLDYVAPHPDETMPYILARYTGADDWGDKYRGLVVVCELAAPTPGCAVLFDKAGEFHSFAWVVRRCPSVEAFESTVADLVDLVAERVQRELVSQEFVADDEERGFHRLAHAVLDGLAPDAGVIDLREGKR